MNSSPLYNIEGLDKKIEKLLKKMSKAGFRVDVQVLKDLEEEVEKKLQRIEEKIVTIVGFQFNLNSPQQVGEVLFEDLGLPKGKKTKTGFSTNESTLKKIKKLHPVIPLLLEYRTLFKLKSTYLHSLQENIDPDSRIHSTFLPDVAATGRIVSRDPNLQNIPIRGKWGRKIRKAFIPKKGRLLLATDYSQIDLRILAHISKEPKLLQAFTDGDDIHAITAMEIFSKDWKKISADDRRIAKTVNFGIIYGISPHGLADTLEIEQKQASYFIETYFHKYPQVKVYLDLSRKEALEKGYSETLGGEKRYIEELKSDNHYERLAGERMAVNFPIQGSAAEIIKLAMVEIDRELSKRKLKAEMILQIHDELLFEVPRKEVNRVIKIVKEKMENAASLSVPLTVSVEKGINWGEMEEV